MMLYNKYFQYGILASIVFCANPLFADTILLRNGQSIIGKIINQTQTTVEIETDSGRRTIQKSQISRIAYGDPAEEKAAEEKRQKAEAEKRKAEEEARRIQEEKRKAEEESRRQIEEESRRKESEAELKKTLEGQLILQERILEKRKNQEKELGEIDEAVERLFRSRQPAFWFVNAGQINWRPSVILNANKIQNINSFKENVSGRSLISQHVYRTKHTGLFSELGHQHQAGKWDHIFSLSNISSGNGPDVSVQSSATILNFTFDKTLPRTEKYIFSDYIQIAPKTSVREAKLRYAAIYHPFRKSQIFYLKNLGFFGGSAFRGQELKQYSFRSNIISVKQLQEDKKFRDLFTDHPEAGKTLYGEGLSELNAGLRHTLEFSSLEIFDIEGGVIRGAGRFNYLYDPGYYRLLSPSTLLKKELKAKGVIETEGSYLNAGYGIQIDKFMIRLFYGKSYIKSAVKKAKLKDPYSAYNAQLLVALISGDPDYNIFLADMIELPQNLPVSLQEEERAGIELRYRYK